MKFAFLIYLLSAPLLWAQSGSSFIKNADSSFIVVFKDPRIDTLLKLQAKINEIAVKESRRTDKGFRILVISTTNRNEAIAAKTKIYTHFPELKAYLWYQSPYYRVKAGNFKDRKEAEAYQRRMNIFFPRGVFIMNDIIEVKPVKESSDQEKQQ
ncbi:MAG: SPOR domain-containing protein [Chitinophagaceae bacterium]|nr:SPOR domain-containing protein [Chitinophagaceae bacterium]